jgi:hypothetical protein
MLAVVRFHDEEFEVERQIRLLINWLSRTVSCGGAEQDQKRSNQTPTAQ